MLRVRYGVCDLGQGAFHAEHRRARRNAHRTSCANGAGAENASREMSDVKTKDQIAGKETAEHEIAK